MKYLIFFSVIPILVSCICCAKRNSRIQSETVKELSLEKYMGTWYEIARYPHSFEKDLAGVTATYILQEDGKVTVQNRGYKGSLNGEIQTIEGKAKVPDKSDPGKLKVSFFWFFYADYYVLEIDSINYQYALVGSSSDKYLWILCRTPQMGPEIYTFLTNKAKERGYNIERLIKVSQP